MFTGQMHAKVKFYQIGAYVRQCICFFLKCAQTHTFESKETTRSVPSKQVKHNLLEKDIDQTWQWGWRISIEGDIIGMPMKAT